MDVLCSTIHNPHAPQKKSDRIYALMKTKVLRFFLNWHNFFIVVNKKDYIMAFFNWHGILLCCNFKSNIIYLFLLCQIKVTTRLLHYYSKIILSVTVANNNFFIPTTSIYVCKSLVNLASKGTIIYFYDGTSPVRHKQNLCI